MKCPFCKTKMKDGVCPKCFAYHVEYPEQKFNRKELKDKLEE